MGQGVGEKKGWVEGAPRRKFDFAYFLRLYRGVSTASKLLEILTPISVEVTWVSGKGPI
jgi:hypothetical protein